MSITCLLLLVLDMIVLVAVRVCRPLSRFLFLLLRLLRLPVDLPPLGAAFEAVNFVAIHFFISSASCLPT